VVTGPNDASDGLIGAVVVGRVVHAQLSRGSFGAVEGADTTGKVMVPWYTQNSELISGCRRFLISMDFNEWYEGSAFVS